ncbi:MAG: NUDIX pyrophosphatase [Bacteroidota bacterium]|jgi:dATP pyrophosphohydrolase
MPNISCTIVEISIFSFENTEAKYLLLRRSHDEPVYPNTWQIVTGSMETGETAVQAALREVAEETGYDPQKIWVVPHVNTFYSAKHDTVHHTVVFAMQVPPRTNPLLSHEHSAYEWCSFERAKKMLVWPGQVRALEVVHEYIVQGKEGGTLSEYHR